MNLYKVTKDAVAKAVVQTFATEYRPKSLLDLKDYFYHYGPIAFDYHKGEEGNIIAVSNNFRHGSIVTSGKDMKEVDIHIKDAILSAFEVPSAYAQEADVKNTAEREDKYAPA